MNQQHLFKTIPNDKYDILTKEDVVTLHKEDEVIIQKLQKEIEKLKKTLNLEDQKSFLLDEKYVLLKNKIFGKSSEKEKRENKKNSLKKKDKDKEKRRRVQLPSQRYPNVPIIERDVTLPELPTCPCCTGQMKDSGMTEDSEFITVIPAKYLVVLQKRHKYSCGNCHGSLITAPAPARITPGSSYSDELTLDVALSKYCDLIPIERYSEIAGRQGMMDIPPQSLIEQTHKLASYLESAADKCKEEVTSSKIIHADESPHKMLEGDERSNWYLWGFSTPTACYFDIQGTRSGDVAAKMLEDSGCEYLVSDVFSGYKKAVRVANKMREKYELPKIFNVYCNAHARRKFKEASKTFKSSNENVKDEAKYFIKLYGKIYRLEGLVTGEEKEERKEEEDSALSLEGIRKWQNIYFRLMERRSVALKRSYSKKSKFGIAMNYFYKNYKELTLFLSIMNLPIDNNSQERLFRSPAVGRKTWYGTHSKKGAKTVAILFTLVQCCKLNKVNPREYFKDLVKDLHAGKEAYTPFEYLSRKRQEIP